MTDEPNAKNLVQSLAKGLRILSVFSAEEPELLLSEVARRASVDNATAFRFLNTLVMLGYVAKVPDTRKFRLTLKPLELGFNAIARMDLRDIARPLLRTLVGAVNEAASFGILEDTEVVYIERVQAGLIRLGVNVRVGTRIPAYYSAIGHAIMAHMPRDQVRALLQASNRVKLTPEMQVSISQIERKIELVRKRGYAVSDGDIAKGLRILAVPAIDDGGCVLGSLSVAAPSMRMPLDRFIDGALAPLQQVARDFSRALSAAGQTLQQSNAG
jgi:IclR family pca regulon transcriptional regulator